MWSCILVAVLGTSAKGSIRRPRAWEVEEEARHQEEGGHHGLEEPLHGLEAVDNTETEPKMERPSHLVSRMEKARQTLLGLLGVEEVHDDGLSTFSFQKYIFKVKKEFKFEPSSPKPQQKKKRNNFKTKRMKMYFHHSVRSHLIHLAPSNKNKRVRWGFKCWKMRMW